MVGLYVPPVGLCAQREERVIENSRLAGLGTKLQPGHWHSRRGACMHAAHTPQQLSCAVDDCTRRDASLPRSTANRGVQQVSTARGWVKDVIFPACPPPTSPPACLHAWVAAAGGPPIPLLVPWPRCCCGSPPTLPSTHPAQTVEPQVLTLVAIGALRPAPACAGGRRWVHPEHARQCRVGHHPQRLSASEAPAVPCTWELLTARGCSKQRTSAQRLHMCTAEKYLAFIEHHRGFLVGPGVQPLSAQLRLGSGPGSMPSFPYHYTAADAFYG